MDRYTKTVLTVIAGCLLVLVGNQVNFHSKAYAVDTAAGSGVDGSGPAVAVNDLGQVYFANGYLLKVVFCEKGSCKVVLDDR